MSDAANNEKLKYNAAALDRVSSGCFIVGGLTPMFSWAIGTLPTGTDLAALAVGSFICVAAGFLFNALGYSYLEHLK